MLLKKGIVRKTFLFSALLIFMVILIAFSAMYFIMPGYYLTQKEKALQNNLSDLAQSLQGAKTMEECAVLVSEFSITNNVSVLSFDRDEALLPAISTPFIGMRVNNAAIISERRMQGMDARQTYHIQFRENEIANRGQYAGVSLLWTQAQGENIMSFESYVGTDIVEQIVVTGTLQPIDEAREVILSLIVYVLAITIAMGLILSGIYARQISKPIIKISGAALKMQQMEVGIKSGIRTEDELGQLSENLDTMYATLLENMGQLRVEIEKANNLERSKTEMMQNASHELKTPIAALNGMIEGMIDNVGVYKNKEKYLVECKNQTDKLSQLVAEILSASKSDIADEGLELSDFLVNELIERVVDENMYQINDKKLKLDTSLPATSITTDASIFHHSISNLISNAVRYTPKNGTVRISIDDDDMGCRLIIENECVAIPADEIPKLFDSFYTRSFSRDKTKSGTGLGLYIVKRGLERLGIPYEAKNTELGFSICLML